MKSYSALIVIVLSFLFSFGVFPSYGQCVNKLETSKITLDKSGEKGSFGLQVTSNGAFTGRLIRIDGTKEYVIDSFSGSRNEKFRFKDLPFSADLIYRVNVDFSNETSFLCQKKVLNIEYANRE